MEQWIIRRCLGYKLKEKLIPGQYAGMVPCFLKENCACIRQNHFREISVLMELVHIQVPMIYLRPTYLSGHIGHFQILLPKVPLSEIRSFSFTDSECQNPAYSENWAERPRAKFIS
jgi:hypothetical protein